MPISTFASPGDHTWTVPDDVDYVILRCWGASGAGNGGDGGYSKGVLPVSPGDTLTIRVGGQGKSTGDTCAGTLGPDDHCSAVGGYAGGGFPNGGDGGATADLGAYGGGGSTEVQHYSSSRSDNIVILAGGGGGGTRLMAYWNHQRDGADGGGALGEGQDTGSIDESNAINVDSALGGESGSYNGGGGSAGQGSSTGGEEQAAAGGGGGGLNGGEGGGHDLSIYEDAGGVVGGGGGDGYQDGALNSTSTGIGVNSGDGTVEIEYSPKVDDLSVHWGDRNQVDLTWGQPHSETSGYDVYRAESPGSTTVDYTHIAALAGGSNTSYTDKTLEDGERYYYRVKATYPDEGDVLGVEDSTITILPSPSNTQAHFVSGDVDITWQNNDNSSDGDISIRRRPAPDGSWSTIVSGLTPTTTSYTDTTPTPGETYDYQVERNTDHISAIGTQTTIGAAGFIFAVTSNSVRETQDSVIVTE